MLSHWRKGSLGSTERGCVTCHTWVFTLQSPKKWWKFLQTLTSGLGMSLPYSWRRCCSISNPSFTSGITILLPVFLLLTAKKAGGTRLHRETGVFMCHFRYSIKIRAVSIKKERVYARHTMKMLPNFTRNGCQWWQPHERLRLLKK
jgi:hypothetical protein